MSNVRTAIQAIRGMSNDEINEIMEAIRLQRNFNSKDAVRSFMVGDTVKFNAGPRRGMRYGTVTKVNIKNIKVRTTDGANWNVAATLLEQDTSKA